jgi:hypothetical protein
VPSGEKRPGIGGVKGNSNSGSRTGPKMMGYTRREWVLVVECLRDEVRVSPSRLRVSVVQLESGKGGDVLLRQTAREEIARRLSTVPSGQLPPHIILRFLVHRDALRTYHLAYPAFDSIEAEKCAVQASE